MKIQLRSAKNKKKMVITLKREVIKEGIRATIPGIGKRNQLERDFFSEGGGLDTRVFLSGFKGLISGGKGIGTS